MTDMAQEQATHRPTVDFDHHSPEYRERWPELYAEMRERCPIAWSPHYDGFWVPVTHELICQVAKNDASFASDFDPHNERKGYQGTNIPRPSNHRVFPMESDPPEYQLYRKALNPFFAPSVAEGLAPFVTEVSNAFIDRVIEDGKLDFVYDFANPVPAIVLMRFLGLPLEDWESYATPMHEIVYAEPGSELQKKAQEGFGWIAEQMLETVRDRRANPRDDMITGLTKLEVDGAPIPEHLLVEILTLVIGGGTDTATNLFSHTILWLEDKPDVRRALAEDDEKLTLAVEEFLRHFTPLQTNARTVTHDLELGGHQLKARDRILVSWAAANRDPAEFERADEMVLDRFPNRHLAFGIGIHRCIGSHIARVEIKAMLREVLRRIPKYEIDRSKAEKYHTIGFLNGYVSMPAMFIPGEKVGTTLQL